MGGVAGGNIASALAVKVIIDKINACYRENMKPASIINMLDSALVAANIEVYDMAYSKPELEGMGTTVVCAVVKDDCAYIAHAGDSRAYLFDGEKLNQVTTDHSVVQNLIEQGKITKEEAEHHPKKNLITRALGVEKNIEIDFDEVYLEDNETLIICTDGLSNYVSDDEVINEVSDGKYMLLLTGLLKRQIITAAVIISPLLQ
jgi:protein phosphatase